MRCYGRIAMLAPSLRILLLVVLHIGMYLYSVQGTAVASWGGIDEAPSNKENIVVHQLVAPFPEHGNAWPPISRCSFRDETGDHRGVLLFT
ncbi:hypothetical protein ACQKWADRAFT_291824 [Trichoderma austrokoningii]